MKNSIFKNFSKFTGKHLSQSLFSCEFWEIFKNTFFTEHLWTTAFVSSLATISSYCYLNFEQCILFVSFSNIIFGSRFLKKNEICNSCNTAKSKINTLCEPKPLWNNNLSKSGFRNIFEQIEGRLGGRYYKDFNKAV